MSSSGWKHASLSTVPVEQLNPLLERQFVHGEQAMLARLLLRKGCIVPEHSHLNEQISYILEGEGEVLMEGQPPLKVKAGDGFIVPAGVKHDAHNTGTTTLKLVGVYVVEKGKPLATPTP